MFAAALLVRSPDPFTQPHPMCLRLDTPALNTDEALVGGHGPGRSRSDGLAALITDESIEHLRQKIVCDLAGRQCPLLRVYIVDDPSSNAKTAPNVMIIVWTGCCSGPKTKLSSPLS